MNPTTPRPFEFTGDFDRILFIEHDIFLPLCFDVSDVTDVDDGTVAEV